MRFTDRGMVRGEVYGAEYLGTTQIVTVTTRYGALKARSPASVTLSDRRERRARLPARYTVDLRQGIRPGDPHRVA